MESIRRRLKKLAPDDLHALSQAIDLEVQRRQKIFADTRDAARRRVIPWNPHVVGVGEAISQRRAA